MQKDRKTILVLFGVSGDLSKRKILPAIENLARKRKLPANFNVLGITRRDISKESILAEVTENKNLKRILEITKLDLEKTSSYNNLYRHLQDRYENAEVIFYLSVPPEQVKNIIGKIGKSSLKKIKNKKLLIEKPFGKDLGSAQKLNLYMKRFFKEDETYRIDHYLLKDIVKNIIRKRLKNKSLEKKWNSNFIEKIEIVASESIGIEGRSSFYENTGALRDMVQSHLLNLLSIVLMELPEGDLKIIPTVKNNPLQSLHLHTDKSKRAQYEEYKKEIGNNESITETFVHLSLEANTPRWQQVKITLTTGKGLGKKDTYVKVYFKNKIMIFREKPNQNKNSYEDVLLKSIQKDRSFFLTDEKILASWKLLKSLQNKWQKNKQNIETYKKGTDLERLLDF